MTYEDDISIGDIVAVNYGDYGRTEGLVIDAYMDGIGRKVLSVRLDGEVEVLKAFPTNVRRVRRTVSYATQVPLKHRTIERTILW